MDEFIKHILYRLWSEKYIDSENVEIYQFGLECMLLKVIHFTSYLFIGLFMGEFLSLIVSGSVLMLLRRSTGGYHAKTKTGCYVFSCSVVALLCFTNKISMPLIVGLIGTAMADTLILWFAPIENGNRKLDQDEKIYFRKRAMRYLLLINTMMGFLFFIDQYLFIAYWLEIGLIFAGGLFAIGLLHQRVLNTICGS